MIDALKTKILRNGLAGLTAGEMQLAAALGLTEHRVREEAELCRRATVAAATLAAVRDVVPQGGARVVRLVRDRAA